ncbi:hypothetical protein B0H14DRAFT_2659175 [Mycena olivaceomarginata]|nr:hypothetical protein B0H14DRAFT_2659175 [Mycena olivaceomarginata]
MDLWPHSVPEVTAISPVDGELDTASEGSPIQREECVAGGACTKRSGGESEGWFLSFRTPTISSIEKTQPGFQTILMGDRSTPERGQVFGGLYRAELEGRNTGRMIVAIYQGDGAEEEWQQHVAQYQSIRLLAMIFWFLLC